MVILSSIEPWDDRCKALCGVPLDVQSLCLRVLRQEARISQAVAAQTLLHRVRTHRAILRPTRKHEHNSMLSSPLESHDLLVISDLKIWAADTKSQVSVYIQGNYLLLRRGELSLFPASFLAWPIGRDSADGNSIALSTS